MRPPNSDERALLEAARDALQRVRDSYISEIRGVAAIYGCELPEVTPEVFPEMVARHLPERLAGVLTPLLQTLSILSGQLASYNAALEDLTGRKARSSHSSNNDVISWQPVSFLPQIREMIDGMLESAEENWRNLQPVRERPHILDDHTVSRLFEVYGSQQEDLWLYRGQLAEWTQEPLTPAQIEEITRLNHQLDKLETVLEKLLDLAGSIQDETIDKLLDKDDLELGLEFLLGKRKP